MHPIPPEQLLPAAGQGALALQCRRDDQRTRGVLSSLHHEPSALCVRIEREVVRRLDGDCHSPIAALATIQGQTVELRVAIGKRGGELPILHAAAKGDRSNPDALLDQVLGALADQNVRSHLHG
jgi:hydroxymethylbilane synthase